MAKYVFKSPLKRAFMAIIDALGGLLFFWVKLMRKKTAAKRILVLRLDQIGDMVQAMPFFASLKKKYSGYEIHAACVKDCAFMLVNNPDIDMVHECGSSWFYNERKNRYGAVLGLIKALKALDFEMCFDLRGDIRNIIFLKLCGAGTVHAYGCAGGAFLIDVMPEYEREEHEADKNLKFLGEKAGDNIRINFPVSAADEEAARGVLKGKDAGSIAVIHPFTRAPSKMWGTAKFEEIINRLKTKGLVSVIIGGPDDSEAGGVMAERTGAVNAAGKLKMPATIALIKKASIFIGNDSGPQYFAAYSGVKTCVIYGFTVNNKRWKPKVSDDNFKGISIPVSCGPCEKTECDSKLGHICMDIITPDMVWEKAEELLNR